ncbi:MAG: peptidoglycan editing factor PgeF, partial [Caulobacteraceae bacterium]
SAGLYASLNAGPGSRDDPVAVAENRRRAATVFDRPAEALLTAYQIHSAEVVVAEGRWGEARPRADGVATGQAGLICGILSADCAPVLIADARARIVAAVHAGWRGALAGVVARAVAAMEGLGASPARMIAAVGPCIGPSSYEVKADFRAAFAAAPDAERFFAEEAGVSHFDLPGFVLDRLAHAGVGRAHWIGRDTAAEADDFFSNRRGHLRGDADYGRLLSAIMLI